MANPNWPSSLPQYVQESGYEETPPSNRIETSMDAGPAKIRGLSTVKNYTFSITLLLTRAQYTAFKTFYDTTTKEGKVPFNWVHPVTRESVVFRFRSPEPRYTGAGGDIFRVSMKLEKVG
jgi:hypothetical protein